MQWFKILDNLYQNTYKSCFNMGIMSDDFLSKMMKYLER